MPILFRCDPVRNTARRRQGGRERAERAAEFVVAFERLNVIFSSSRGEVTLDDMAGNLAACRPPACVHVCACPCLAGVWRHVSVLRFACACG